MSIAPAHPTPSPPTRSEPPHRESAPDASDEQFERVLARHADAPPRGGRERPPETQARGSTDDGHGSAGERTASDPGRTDPDRDRVAGRAEHGPTEQSDVAAGPADATDRDPATPTPPAADPTGGAPAPVGVDVPPDAASSSRAAAPGTIAASTLSLGPTANAPVAGTTPPVSATGDTPAPGGPAAGEPTPLATTAGTEIATSGAVDAVDDPPAATRSVAPTATPATPAAPTIPATSSGEAAGRPAAPGTATTDPAAPSAAADTTGTPDSGTSDGADAGTAHSDAGSRDRAARVDSASPAPPGPERTSGVGDAAGPLAATRSGVRDQRGEPAMHATPSSPVADDLLARAELRRVTGRGSRLDIGLSTSDLGRIEVVAVDRGNGLQLQLTSDQPDARRHLARHLDELRGDLADAGVDVGSLDVGDSPRHGRESGQPRPSRLPAGSGPAPTSPHPPTPPDSAPARVEPLQTADGLDLRL